MLNVLVGVLEFAVITFFMGVVLFVLVQCFRRVE